MTISVHSRHTPLDKLEKKYPGATFIDVTSRGEQPWVKFSPFFPLGEIPVPGVDGLTSQTVEGIWQGLKVFESEGIDLARMENTSMRGLKRTVRKYGTCLGHQPDPGAEELLGYLEARFAIYLPAYRWALENRLQEEIEQLRELSEQGDVVLLDYETNADVFNLRKPLSHAWLVAHYLHDAWPEPRQD